MRQAPIIRLISFGLFVVGIAPGCQSVHLREASLNQAAAYGDVLQGQVLDNLAKFVYDINSFASFAYSDQGTNQIQDQLSTSSTTGWQRLAAGIHVWDSSTLVPSAQRQFYQNWVLKPINDPRKLDLMRCAYQQVVRANLVARGLSEHGACAPCDGGLCPDCTKRFNSFYTGRADTPTPPPGAPDDKGRITNLCLGNNPVWFAWGCKKDVPKHPRPVKVGHYRGMYVWVLPGGVNELSKLTLAILDYAVNAPAEAPKQPTKQASFYVDKDGEPTTQANAVGVVTGNVDANLPAASLLRPDLLTQATALRARMGQEYMEKEAFEKKAFEMKVPNAQEELKKRQDSIDSLRVEINRLDQLIDSVPPIPPLPAPHRPSIDEATGPGLLDLQLRLRSLQPLPNLNPTVP